MSMRLRFAVPAACMLAAVAVAVAAAHDRIAALPVRPLRSVVVPVAGPPAALALTTGGRRLLLAAGHELYAFDTASGVPVGTLVLPGIPTALALHDAHGYVALRTPAAIAVLALHPLRVLRVLRLHQGSPSGLAVAAGAHALFVEHAGATDIEAVDPHDGRRLAVIALGTAPAQMADNGYGRLFVSLPARNAIAVIDTRALRLAGSIPTPGCRLPTGLAIDPVGRRLFVACGNGGVSVIDADIGFTFERLSAPAGAARGVFAFKPLPGWKGGAFFVYASTLAAVRMYAFIRYADGGQVPLPAGSAVLALDPAHQRIWLALPAAHGSLTLQALDVAPSATPAAAP